MEIKERILQYAAIVGISSREKSIAKHLCDELTEMGISASIDKNGNVHGSISCNNPGAKTLLLEAHLDQIGLMVSGIDRDGSLQFAALGGVDERILCGMEVEVETDPPLYGVIGALRSENEEKNLKIEELRIDIGLPYEKTREVVRVGDVVAIQNSPRCLLGDIVSGAAMDNRAGVAAIMDCLEKVSGKSLSFHLELLFSTGEELGLQGAYTGTEPDMADAAIVVDVTHAMTPDTKEATGVFPLGSGVVICRGPSLCDAYTRQLLALAKEKQIPHEIEVASGNSGTTAWAIQTVGAGISVMLTSIPLRYMHSNLETLSLKDVRAVSDLLCAVVTGGITLEE